MDDSFKILGNFLLFLCEASYLVSKHSQIFVIVRLIYHSLRRNLLHLLRNCRWPINLRYRFHLWCHLRLNVTLLNIFHDCIFRGRMFKRHLWHLLLDFLLLILIVRDRIRKFRANWLLLHIKITSSICQRWSLDTNFSSWFLLRL